MARIIYVVNLDQPYHVEHVELVGEYAELRRWLALVCHWKPTASQLRKIKDGKGKFNIYDK